MLHRSTFLLPQNYLLALVFNSEIYHLSCLFSLTLITCMVTNQRMGLGKGTYHGLWRAKSVT